MIEESKILLYVYKKHIYAYEIVTKFFLSKFSFKFLKLLYNNRDIFNKFGIFSRYALLLNLSFYFLNLSFYFLALR